MKKLFVEEVESWFANHPIISKARRATQKEINESRRLHKLGKPPHSLGKNPACVFYDKGGWMYDERKCGICDKFLDLI